MNPRQQNVWINPDVKIKAGVVKPLPFDVWLNREF